MHICTMTRVKIKSTACRVYNEYTQCSDLKPWRMKVIPCVINSIYHGYKEGARSIKCT